MTSRLSKSPLECSSEGNLEYQRHMVKEELSNIHTHNEISSPRKSLLLRGAVFRHRLNRTRSLIKRNKSASHAPLAGTTHTGLHRFCCRADCQLAFAPSKAPVNSRTLAIIRCYPGDEDIVMLAAAKCNIHIVKQQPRRTLKYNKTSFRYGADVLSELFNIKADSIAAEIFYERQPFFLFARRGQEADVKVGCSRRAGA
jgi:hypothetical protein